MMAEEGLDINSDATSCGLRRGRCTETSECNLNIMLSKNTEKKLPTCMIAERWGRPVMRFGTSGKASADLDSCLSKV